MMRIARPRQSRKPENTIALINVVFLMLIFFLIAGTLAPPADQDVRFITAENPEPAAPPDMMFIRQDGTWTWRGREMSPPEILSEWRGMDDAADGDPAFRIASDRDLPAVKLIEAIETLRKAGVEDIVLVTLREGR